MITVYGDQNGDQSTAKVIVYNQFRGGGQFPQQPPPQQQWRSWKGFEEQRVC
jgi:hypothetical protein